MGHTSSICICNNAGLCSADDIALLSEQIEQAQEMLERVERAAVEIGLHMNAKKTKTMAYNQENDVNITARDGTKL